MDLPHLDTSLEQGEFSMNKDLEIVRIERIIRQIIIDHHHDGTLVMIN